MSYRVEVSPAAHKEITALPGHVRAQALHQLRALSEDPRPPRAKELREKPNIFRLWLARRWRIVYRVEEDPRRVLVLRVRLKDRIDYPSVDAT